MLSKETRSKRPAPPRIRKFVRHARAMSIAIELIRDHWTSFTSIVADEFQDGVAETKIFNLLTDAMEEAVRYAHTIDIIPELTDAAYNRELRVLMTCAE